MKFARWRMCSIFFLTVLIHFSTLSNGYKTQGGSTLVSNLEYTKNSNISYGIVRKRDIFRDNKIQLILLIAAYIIFLFLLTLMIRRLKKEADIDASLKVIIALVAFVFYIIYTCENAHDVEKLALASILLLVLPFVIKLSLGLFIIIRDSKTNPRFRDWIKEHTVITFFFVILTGVDLDALTLLNSGMKETSLSKSARKWIAIIECVGLFLRDLPILAILVLYYKLALDYGIIPFFALISLIMLIVYAIIWNMLSLLMSYGQKPVTKSSVIEMVDEPEIVIRGTT
ncbi:hypothetical protein RclHR1_00480001 [Rhizophagus clarus]|uniref:Glycosyltransferase family 2 protein n=1 Tax=Rhizophagus clarus TaxID=94130 RepID=A0A2Z6RKC6_9GLOM|nr:hypothetical protein RclHR1_00480001 [Rhizophagus clarus]GET00450.1 glycosyltransferase family 2 protein [Rhizophagus clarus]